MPLVRDPLWEHFMSDLSSVKYLGLGCLLYAAAYCMLRRRLPALWGSLPAAAMTALCAWAAGSFLTLGAPIAWDKSPLFSYTCFLMLLVVTVSVVDNWRRFEHVLWAMVVSVSIASLYIVREWQEYHNIYAQFRPGWVTGDPNYFTASALIGLPLALAFCGRGWALWKRLFAGGCALLTLAAAGLAASRGGLLGLLAMTGWLAWKKRHLGVFVLLVSLAAPPLLLWSRSPLNRLMHPSASDIKSSNTRLALWQAGLNMIEQHPLRGIGLGEFKAEVERYAAGHDDLDHIAHNTYLALAAEMGLPALMLYAAMLAGAWFAFSGLHAAAVRDGGHQPARRRGSDALRFADDASPPAPEADGDQAPAMPAWLANAALGMQAAILGFSVSAIFLSAQYTKLFWLLIAVSATAASLRSQTAAVTAEAKPATFATNLLEPAPDAGP
ncbi:MAG: O-antigen ligase family protein [Terriglobales bacterium]